MEENESRKSEMCGKCSIPDECACTCKYDFQLCEMENNNELPSREELAKQLLSDNRDMLEYIAKQLLEKETRNVSRL